MVILENIDIDMNIDMNFLENIDINMDFLENTDINMDFLKISISISIRKFCKIF